MRAIAHRLLFETRPGEALLAFVEWALGLAVVAVESVQGETVGLMEKGENL